MSLKESSYSYTTLCNTGSRDLSNGMGAVVYIAIKLILIANQLKLVYNLQLYVCLFTYVATLIVHACVIIILSYRDVIKVSYIIVSNLVFRCQVIVLQSSDLRMCTNIQTLFWRCLCMGFRSPKALISIPSIARVLKWLRASKSHGHLQNSV